jgi:hypothetical protein
MLLTNSAVSRPETGNAETTHFFVLRGLAQILRMQAVLIRFSAICDQTGAMDYLEYFLTATENLKKTPYLILLASRSDVDIFELRAQDLKGAALAYEYRVFGLSSGVFSTSDFTGSRNVIAPADMRPRLSVLICRYLMERGAQAVLLTFASDSDEDCQGCFDAAIAGHKKYWWTTQTRIAGATLALEKTFEATLLMIGKETRRNLRRYRRKAEAELNCIFAGDVKNTLSKEQLVELNHASAHPIANHALERRYNTMKTLEGAFCVGVKTPDGQWISLLGGRRHHGVAEIDWQMNRGGLEKYSVGTIIRAYLIEHEIAIGTGWLFFEGGTPHTMRHSFLMQKTVDIVALDRSLLVFLLRKWVRWSRGGRNFLLQTLSDRALKWELH